MIDRKCPVRHLLYGGLPASGGYGSATEYEVGAQRICEAAHCILGSLGRNIGPGKDDWASMRRVERGHLREELGIIERCVREYSRPLYVDRLFRPEPGKEKRAAETIESISGNAPKLIELARERLADFVACSGDVPDAVVAAATSSYAVIIELSKALLSGLRSRPPRNAFADVGVLLTVAELRHAIDRLLPDR